MTMPMIPACSFEARGKKGGSCFSLEGADGDDSRLVSIGKRKGEAFVPGEDKGIERAIPLFGKRVSERIDRESNGLFFPVAPFEK